MMPPRYCTRCGRQLDIVKCGYDGFTGEVSYVYKLCPVKDCEHGYHKYKLFSATCKICGERMSVW